MAGDDQVLTARWVFPATSAPIAHGRVTVRDGRIVAVGPRDDRHADLDFGNAAIIPGLVNAHTHLDLSGLRNQVSPTNDFVGWLRRIVSFRRTQQGRDPTEAIRQGLSESLDHGTTLIADISGDGRSWSELASAPIWAYCFRELLGLPGSRVDTVWSIAVEWMHDHPDTATCRAGVSPHAPYSVHKAIIEAAARIWPVCVHVAESMHEQELLTRRSGPFVPFLKDLGVWDPAGLAASWDWLSWRIDRSPCGLMAHGNYLDQSKKFASSVVYCPRTHAAFGHSPHPFVDMMATGTNVALGTDSLASTPDLDLLAEARFIFQSRPEVEGETILRMATVNGARALGMERLTGSLEVRKSADLVIVPLPDRDEASPHSLLFAEHPGNRRTMWRGRWRTTPFPMT